MTFNSLTSRMTRAARQRARYRKTVAELRALPLDVALDLDIDRDAAAAIAARAVYGA